MKLLKNFYNLLPEWERRWLLRCFFCLKSFVQPSKVQRNGRTGSMTKFGFRLTAFGSIFGEISMRSCCKCCSEFLFGKIDQSFGLNLGWNFCSGISRSTFLTLKWTASTWSFKSLFMPKAIQQIWHLNVLLGCSFKRFSFHDLNFWDWRILSCMIFCLSDRLTPIFLFLLVEILPCELSSLWFLSSTFKNTFGAFADGFPKSKS